MDIPINFIILLFFCIATTHSLSISETVDDIGSSRIGSVVPLNLNTVDERLITEVNLKMIDLPLVKYYANLAGAAYCKDVSLSAFTCGPYCQDVLKGTEDTIPTSKVKVIGIYRDFLSGTKGYLSLIDERKEISLSFSGERPQSTKLSIYGALLAPLNVNYKGNNNTGIRTNSVSVHALLYAASLRLFDEYSEALVAILNSEKRRNYKVVINGHSIGGSIAQLSSVIVHHQLEVPWDKIRMLSYSQLRSGNREFARWYSHQNLEAVRVSSYNDKVQLLLPHKLGFYHFGNHIFIEQDGSTTYCHTKYLEHADCTKLNFDLVLRESHVKVWNTEFGIDC